VTAAGTYAATAGDSYTWKNVSPGIHTFSAELINNDNTPLSPPVVSKITVTVKNPVPTSPPPVNATPVTSTASGASSNTYCHFGAPSSAGDYYFVRDGHPQVMNGPFVIAPQ